MSRRKIDTRARVKKPKGAEIHNHKIKLFMQRKVERDRDDEMIRRYIHDKDFDMECRYDYDYRKEWSEKSGIPMSRLNKALDRVIAEAWRNIREGKVPDAKTDES